MKHPLQKNGLRTSFVFTLRDQSLKMVKKNSGFLTIFASASIVALAIPAARTWLISGLIGFNTKVDINKIVFMGKPAWDWAQLLIVPLLLLSLQQAIKGQEEARKKQEKELAEDRDRQEALKEYLNQMTTLLLDPAWPTTKLESESQQKILAVARAKTLTVLREIDGERKGSVIRFLIESEALHFISLSTADLKHANLSSTNLTNADLRGANLESANLTKTKLESADLCGSILSKAKIGGTDFQRANLSLSDLTKVIIANPNTDNPSFKDANLQNANLRKADLRRAILVRANLTRADLSKADLESAYLSYANLSYSKLQSSKFNGAEFTRTNFHCADIQDANFEYAELRGADLRTIKGWTKEQLTSAKFWKTMLPKGCDLNPDRDRSELVIPIEDFFMNSESQQTFPNNPFSE